MKLEYMIQYFDLLSQIIQEKDIAPWNIFNMDETGRQLHPQRCKSLMRASQKTGFLRKHGDKAETISIIECICANGTALVPTVIFKGVNIMTSWLTEIHAYNDFRPNIACSPNGWTDNELAMHWLRDFIVQIQFAQGTKLLLLDGILLKSSENRIEESR